MVPPVFDQQFDGGVAPKLSDGFPVGVGRFLSIDGLALAVKQRQRVFDGCDKFWREWFEQNFLTPHQFVDSMKAPPLVGADRGTVGLFWPMNQCFQTLRVGWRQVTRASLGTLLGCAPRLPLLL